MRSSDHTEYQTNMEEVESIGRALTARSLPCAA
jgi:hypothetical protein